jgi:hypothetical protein
MAYQQVRANFPKNGDGNTKEPMFMQQVDASGNLATPDNGLTPQGGTAVAGSSGDVANASAVAAIAGVASKLNYITGFEVIGLGATAAGTVNVTVTGLAGGTMTYPLAIPAGVNTQNPMLSVQFAPPHPASAVNTAITVTCPALGAGNAHNCANVRGIQV